MHEENELKMQNNNLNNTLCQNNTIKIIKEVNTYFYAMSTSSKIVDTHFNHWILISVSQN